jgi:predicted YcjX-like family ATPase
MTQAERDALLAALPEGATSPRFAARQAGLGSLGRPRFMVRAELAGAPVLRVFTTMIGWDRQPIAHSETDCRADMMDYRVTLHN